MCGVANVFSWSGLARSLGMIYERAREFIYLFVVLWCMVLATRNAGIGCAFKKSRPANRPLFKA
jgi:hypothetical protein